MSDQRRLLRIVGDKPCSTDEAEAVGATEPTGDSAPREPLEREPERVAEDDTEECSEYAVAPVHHSARCQRRADAGL